MSQLTKHTKPLPSGTTLFDVWDPRFNKPVTLIIVAPRGSGKSVLLSDILYQNRDFFDDIHVFAGSQAVIDDFKPRLPKSRLTHGYSSEKMRKLIQEFTTTAEIFKKINPDKKFQGALVMDDLAFDKKIFSCVTHLQVMNIYVSHSVFLFLFFIFTFVSEYLYIYIFLNFAIVYLQCSVG
jgi:hypothetical protein